MTSVPSGATRAHPKLRPRERRGLPRGRLPRALVVALTMRGDEADDNPVQRHMGDATPGIIADFFLVARTETLIAGQGVPAAVDRCNAYAGADAVLIHSKKRAPDQIVEFLEKWNRRLPVVVVPTTYPDWSALDAERHGVAVLICANQGLRSAVTAMSDTYRRILSDGSSAALEDGIASLDDVFDLQDLGQWTELAG